MYYELTLTNKGKTTNFYLGADELKSYIADEVYIAFANEKNVPIEKAKSVFHKNLLSNFRDYSPQSNNDCELYINKHCDMTKDVSPEALDTDPDIARLSFAEYAVCNYLKPIPILEKISNKVGKNAEIGTRYLLTEDVIQEVKEQKTNLYQKISEQSSLLYDEHTSDIKR